MVLDFAYLKYILNLIVTRKKSLKKRYFNIFTESAVLMNGDKKIPHPICIYMKIVIVIYKT